MATTLFVFPLKKGKKDAYKAFLKEAMTTRKSEYKDLLMRHSLNNVKVWFQSLDGKDYAMFTHDMDGDPASLEASWASSSHPFDLWFDKHLRDCYDIEDKIEQPKFFDELDGRK